LAGGRAAAAGAACGLALLVLKADQGAAANSTPPVITVMPQSQAIEAGGWAAFGVGVANPETLAYQWVFNGTNALPGATNSALVLTNLQLAQAGAYTVVVTNNLGAVTSAPARLTVIPLGTTPVAYCTAGALRAALAGPGPVTFACDGTFVVTNTLTIASNILLDGTGHRVTISGGNSVQVFRVISGGTLSAANLTISDGLSSSAGGGIYNDGSTVNLTNCTLAGHRASGLGQPSGGPGAKGFDGRGGAIFNSGSLNASLCSFRQNSAAGGAGSSGTMPYYGSAGYAGGQGSGGAIFNSGTLTVDRSVFVNNTATGDVGSPGGPGGRAGPNSIFPGGPGGGGGGGQGAAICNFGVLTVGSSLFLDNQALGGAGGNGGDCGWGMPSWVPPGGAGGVGGSSQGAAICNFGVLTVGSSLLVDNEARGGDGGNGGQGGSGYWTSAGGDGGAAGSGYGSGLYSASTAAVVNATFAQNVCLGGWGGSGGAGGSNGYQQAPAGAHGADGSGFAALHNTNGALRLTNCTVALNPGVPCGGLSGAGASLVNTLLASNRPCNGSGAIADGGHNLSSDASCAFTNTGSLNLTDPRIGPLADNGGPTLTFALLPGSPAIGAADSAAAPATDQRGYPRPAGSADIGAYEFGFPPVLLAAQPTGRGADVSVSGRPGVTCRLLVSPDLPHWTTVATNQFLPDGTTLFHDLGGASQPRRFYRALMP
jgi:hypothetical protein